MHSLTAYKKEIKESACISLRLSNLAADDLLCKQARCGFVGIFQLIQIPSLVEPLVRILLLVVCLIQLNVLYSSRVGGM